MAQTILLFELKENKLEKLLEICNILGITTRQIQPKDYRQKMGYLAGIRGFSREHAVYSGGALPTEMLVFSGMDSDQVDSFLAAYRESELEPIALKAQLTPHNVRWTPRELFSELMKEHLAFSSNNEKIR